MLIRDIPMGRTREYGTNQHDSLAISEDGTYLYYENLQNGETSMGGDYVFVTENGEIPEEDREYQNYECEAYFNIGGFKDRETTCYRKDRAIDKFREDMYSASDKVQQTVDMYSAMKIFNQYLDDTSAEWQKHVDGRWVYAKCSKCGGIHDVQSKFCPSCGCAMERWEEQA